jgi:hypothetical protein
LPSIDIRLSVSRQKVDRHHRHGRSIIDHPVTHPPHRKEPGVRVRVTVATLATALSGALVLPAAASAAPTAADPGDAHTMIIGGTTVSSAPWAAAVSNRRGFACSGSLVAPEWVLTATHCLDGAMSVRVGSVNRSSGGVTSGVTAIQSRYDLTLLKLARPVTGTTVMPLANANPPVNATTSLYGWGMTCFSNCNASTQLKTAQVRVTSNNVTDAAGGRAIASTSITGNAWRGDSGGPQVYQGAQVGVASTADGVARQYYGSVAYNRAWLKSVTGV